MDIEDDSCDVSASFLTPLMSRLGALTVVGLLAAPLALAQSPADPRVERALSKNNVVYSVEPNGDYRMLYETENGRSQLVWIRPETYSVGDVEVREIFSYADDLSDDQPLPPGWAEKLLVYNGDYVVGAWSRYGDRVTFSARVDANAPDHVLIGVMTLVLNTADLVEEEMTGLDDW